jgi:lipopolysaccharide transport system ATP-binding protein
VSTPVLKVSGLGKEYVIGSRDKAPQTFREMLGSSLVAPFRRFRKLSGRVESQERFWALKDVNFEVHEGEVVGIIGRNGAGKSTLLKILSRITAPTEGCVEVRGRVASLLEVGTGFHPELTGHENVYLNGAILGMSRAEINRKFDEIVGFAEVEKFLDTPVKHYSSGMYVRLAFAVAAHLEPEILLVDEVLAVGDDQFQKKCLGKMRNVAAQEGRTVLFVSHNLQAVQSLCRRAILLDAGLIAAEGPSRSVVSMYLAEASPHSGERIWSLESALGTDDIRLIALRVLAPDGRPSGTLSSEQDICVELDFLAQREPAKSICIGFDLTNQEGITLLRTYQTDSAPERWPPINKGVNRWQCRIPSGLLNGGEYVINPRISVHNVSWIVHTDAVLRFHIHMGRATSPLWGQRPGLIAPMLDWCAISRNTSPICVESKNATICD